MSFIARWGENRQQLVDDLTLEELFSIPWGHHVQIICKCNKSPSKAVFYVRRALKYNWSRSVLMNFLDTNLYEREGKAVSNFKNSVTVYRPIFDEQGNRVSPPAEVKVKPEEVKAKTEEVKAKTEEVKAKPDFEAILKAYRKDLRETCSNVWTCLASDSNVTQREIAVRLKISESSVLSAMNALQEVGLLGKTGYGKGRNWIVRTTPNEETDK